MNLWQDFPGPNAAYVLELYQRYQQNPGAVDPTTRAYFEQWQPSTDGVEPVAAMPMEAIVGVINLAQAIRRHGHLAARLDPLNGSPALDPVLDMNTYQLTADTAYQRDIHR